LVSQELSHVLHLTLIQISLQLVPMQDQVCMKCNTIVLLTSHLIVGIYSLNNGGLQTVVKGHSGGITHLAFSANGNYLFSGGRKVRVS